MKMKQVRYFPRSGTRQLYVATVVHAVDLVAVSDLHLPVKYCRQNMGLRKSPGK